jgi:hypothetical protein
MKLASPRAWLPALALVAAGSVGLAQIERFTLEKMVQRADHAVAGTIVKSKVFRVDHPVDGPELYFTTLTIRGRSLMDGKAQQLDVTFPGGFISETEGVWNSEAPTADEIRVGNRVVAFAAWTDNMGGDVAANALIASHGGLYRIAGSGRREVVLGRGDGYAVSSNVKMERLGGDVAELVTKHK